MIHFRLSLLSFGVSVWGSVQNASNALTAVRLEPGLARCLDGSPYLYYWQAGSAAKKFFIYLEGGDECTTAAECASRAQSALGSSLRKYWPDELPLQPRGPHFSRDPRSNPLLHDWNFVFLIYCDGGYYGGERAEPLKAGASDVFLRGKFNVQSTLQHLSEAKGMGSATDIIIGGCSSGGVAVFMQIDFWAKAGWLPKDAHFGGLPDSGYYLWTNTTTSWTQPVAELHNISSVLNPECVAAESFATAWRCIDAEVVSPFLRTPVFALQSRYDSNQLTYSPCRSKSGKEYDSCVQSYGENLTDSIHKWMKPRKVLHGAFVDACSRHCSKTAVGGPVKGVTPHQALASWWTDPNSSWLWDQPGSYPCAQCCQHSQESLAEINFWL
eukprot:gnl/MRDRNA2_/MRDRNA2_135948_c0_seq1.p1 gnl/MRDRNA2_/MRDRNA2_135948_c0~~gnl/MRDRNA2_/MRDRNA2_135948_c0_seq1.p1  ORF type:complete len:383 (+),score=28.47 gnl/MRDRNA2_/MRDRNA2_135948_c0_seq1:96-1244(+)